MTIDDFGQWPAHQGGGVPTSSGDGNHPDERADAQELSYPDLGTIHDAFDTDDSEPEPEYGDFWQQPDEEELWG